MDGPNHYDPTTGRWTAPDPMGDAGGDPDWYGYCLDDPVNMIDPLGLEGFGVSGYGYYGAEWGGNPTGGKGDSSGDAESKNSREQTGDSDNGENKTDSETVTDKDPKTKEETPETEEVNEVSSFMQKAMKMNNDRRAALAAEEAANAKQTQEDLSTDYAKGKSVEKEVEVDLEEAKKEYDEARDKRSPRGTGLPQDLVGKGEVQVSHRDISNWGPATRIARDTTPLVTRGSKTGTTERLNRDYWGTVNPSVLTVQSVMDPIGQEVAKQLAKHLVEAAGYGTPAAATITAIAAAFDVLFGGSEAY